jgi:hypothetical protein
MSNLTQLAIKAEVPTVGDGPHLPSRQTKSTGKFIRGPIDWGWVSSAAKHPGRALHVAIAIAYLDGFEKTGTVTVRPGVCRELGVDRHASYRALRQLEAAGLVTITRKRGAAAVVTVIRRNSMSEMG